MRSSTNYGTLTRRPFPVRGSRVDDQDHAEIQQWFETNFFAPFTTMPNEENDLDLASLASSSTSNRSKDPNASDNEDEDYATPSPRSSLSRLSTASFSYNDLLFPLTTSAEDPSGHARLEKMKTVTYWSGLSLVVGLQIGSGIFSSPALVNRNAGSIGMSLIVWIVAGCLVWTGAGILDILKD